MIENESGEVVATASEGEGGEMDDEIMWGFLAWLNHMLGSSIRSNIYISLLLCITLGAMNHGTLCVYQTMQSHEVTDSYAKGYNRRRGRPAFRISLSLTNTRSRTVCPIVFHDLRALTMR